MLEKEWAPVIAAAIAVMGALGGAIIGGAITYFVKRQELSHQKEESNRIHIRSKLEELHELTATFQEECNNHTIKILYLKANGFSMEEYSDAVEKIKGRIGKLYSLHHRYIPEKHDAWQIFISAFSKYFDISFKFLINQVDVDNLRLAAAKVDEACQNMMNVVQAELRRDFGLKFNRD